MGKLSDFLMTMRPMREARDDVANKKNAKRAKEKRREEEKERIGISIISATMSLRNTEDDINKEDTGDECKVSPNQSSLKVRIVNISVGKVQMEMDRFEEHL